MRVLVGLIGSDIGASGSPAIHQREACHPGIDFYYHLIDLTPRDLTARDLPALVDAAQLFGFAGLNITHPCKQAVIPFLHDLSPESQAIGALNTVVFRDGRRFGHNTDWTGFRNSLSLGLPHRSIPSCCWGRAGPAVPSPMPPAAPASRSSTSTTASQPAPPPWPLASPPAP
jgi:shikimate dehydrogenase